MKFRTLILFVLGACLAAAATLDGTWTSEMKMRGGKKGGGQDRTVTVTLNLKAQDGQVTGTVVSGGKKKSSTAQIQDGKLDGNQFSFTTVSKGKKGEMKQQWKGTLDGDNLSGTRSRDGGKRGQPFTAKRG